MAQKRARAEMKDKTILVAVTDEQHREYHAHAKAKGLQLAVLIRLLLDRDIREAEKGEAA